MGAAYRTQPTRRGSLPSMRARDIVGKTVASVRQHFYNNGEGAQGWWVDSITFTDGTALVIHPVDAGYFVAAEVQVIKPQEAEHGN